MYGLDKDVDLSFLMNKEVIQIAIGLYQVILYFEKNISIMIAGEFDHQIDGKSIKEKEEFPESARSLIKLLGNKVIDVKNQGEGTLELRFSNGNLIQIFDDDKNYESYTITSDSGNIIV